MTPPHTVPQPFSLAVPTRPVLRSVFLSAVLVALAGAALAGCDSDAEAGALPDEGFVEVNGARIYYQAQGDAGDPAMVLVHGYPLSSELFREQLDGLSDEYRVVALDLRGYGRSTTPDDEATVGTYAEDVLDVMTELGIDRAVIGGMSMGGPVAFEMYRRAPDRFRGLLLIDTIAAAASPPEAGLWMGTMELVREMGVSAIPPLFVDEFVTGQGRRDRPELVEALTDIINDASEDAAIAGLKVLANRPDSQPTLDTIDVPTLVLVGLQDTVYPFEIAQRMAEMIGSNATLEVLDDASHGAVLEAGDRANAAIRDWADDLGD